MRSVAPGDDFAQFRVESLLGAGGMGQVVAAYDRRLRRRVALKLLRGDGAPLARESTLRMMREARAAAAIRHPGVVAVHDVGEHDGVPYIVMELVDGKPLRAYRDDATVPTARRVRWLVEIARALEAAHAASVIHRDVKPDNVMIDLRGVARVLDFGIAKRLRAPGANEPTYDGPLSFVTEQGHVLGTPKYMAPEQFLSEPVDARADQYAWGVVAYELLSGRHPTPSAGSGMLSAGKALIEVSPAPLGPDVPAPVAAVVMRALAKLPSQRHGSMGEIARALEPFSERIAESDASSASIAPRLDPPTATPPAVAPVAHAAAPSSATLTSPGPIAPPPAAVAPPSVAGGFAPAAHRQPPPPAPAAPPPAPAAPPPVAAPIARPPATRELRPFVTVALVASVLVAAAFAVAGAVARRSSSARAARAVEAARGVRGPHLSICGVNSGAYDDAAVARTLASRPELDACAPAAPAQHVEVVVTMSREGAVVGVACADPALKQCLLRAWSGLALGDPRRPLGATALVCVTRE